MREESTYVIYSELTQKHLIDMLLGLKYSDDDEVGRRADCSLRNYVESLRRYGPMRMKEVNMAIADLLGAGERK